MGTADVPPDATPVERPETVMNAWADICERYGWGFAVVSDATETFSLMNQAFASSLGYRIEELVGRQVPFIYAPENRSDVSRYVRAAKERGACVFESVHIRKDGTTFPVQVDVTVVEADEGSFLAVCVQDITERRRAEARLQEAEGRYRALFDGASDAFITAHLPDGAIDDANLAATQLLGYSREELIGLSGREHIIAPEVLEHTELEWQRQLEEQGNFLVETLWVRKDASRVPVAVSGTTCEIQGRVQFQLIGRDITERKRMEEALQRAREDLEGKVARRVPPSDAYELTFRELSVLHLIAEGKPDKEIADVLGIRPLTASKHVTNILSKMSAASRTEAGVRAVREGLVS